jgi:endonuclease YncB( thermonuclease family)
LFLLLAVLPHAQAQAVPPAVTEHARVATVIDGDTVVLADGRHVRLLGINTPERGRNGAPDEPLYREAKRRLNQLVGGERVALVAGVERRDRHGRTLAHLLLPSGRNVQVVLLEEGLAFAVAIPPNIRFLEPYLAAERRARVRRTGLWSEPYYAPQPAATLQRGDTGFRLVRGRVQSVGQSRRYVYLDLAPRMSLMVPNDDWQRYFRGRPRDWEGRMLVARGWISQQGDKLRMRIGHPSMIEAGEN